MTDTLIDRERSIWNAEAERLLDNPLQTLPATDYVKWISGKRHHLTFDEFLRGNPQKDLPALQLGAGDIFYLLLPDIGYRSFDIGDLADRALELAKKRAAAVGEKASYNYQNFDAHELPYEEGRFGLVIANAVLHHLDRKRFVPELARVTAPGGRVLFFDPHMVYPLRALLWTRALRQTDRGSDNPLNASDVNLLGHWFNVRVIKFGALSGLLNRLLPKLDDRARRLDVMNALMSADLTLSSDLPGYGHFLCNHCILMAERNDIPA